MNESIDHRSGTNLVYRLKPINESNKYSKAHGKWIWRREYRVIGTVDTRDAVHLLMQVLQSDPKKQAVAVLTMPGGRELQAFWQTDTVE